MLQWEKLEPEEAELNLKACGRLWSFVCRAGQQPGVYGSEWSTALGLQWRAELRGLLSGPCLAGTQILTDKQLHNKQHNRFGLLTYLPAKEINKEK